MIEQFNWQDILHDYYPQFCQVAANVGVDGCQLYQALPPCGKLITGTKLPVLGPKYRGKCGVIFYINTTKNGSTWPYFKFMSFKHGGVSQEFNGLRYRRLSRDKQIVDVPLSFSHSVFTTPPHPSHDFNRDKGMDDHWRAKNFWANNQDYFSSEDGLSCPWLKQRLCGYANSILLERVALRWSKRGYLLVPISHVNHGLIGYHKILFGANNQKRHQILKAGLLKGASVLVTANAHCMSDEIAICEGMATGLSLALVWPGRIYIALSAGNLMAVRQSLSQYHTVTFFADNDSWKPEVGNTGIDKAQAAALPEDKIVVPYFPPQFASLQPTDFNDVLCLSGLNELIRQVRPS
jgi:hypothetical protein